LKAVGYFKLTPPVPSDCSGIPSNRDAHVTPNCIKAGEHLEAKAVGIPWQYGVFWSTISPSGKRENGSGGYGLVARIYTDLSTERGIWQVAFSGQYTEPDVSIGYYKILPP